MDNIYGEPPGDVYERMIDEYNAAASPKSDDMIEERLTDESEGSEPSNIKQPITQKLCIELAEPKSTIDDIIIDPRIEPTTGYSDTEIPVDDQEPDPLSQTKNRNPKTSTDNSKALSPARSINLVKPKRKLKTQPSANSTEQKKQRTWKQNFVRDKTKKSSVDQQPSNAETQSKEPKRKRSNIFTPEQKRKLLAEVKKYNAIWDITSGEHFNSNVLHSCWSKIAQALNETEADCKTVWVSLRESYRYRIKQAKPKASGSAGGEPIPEPSHQESANDWEFTVDLAFLPDTSKKRKTITSFSDQDDKEEEDKEEEEEEERKQENDSFKSNYSYKSRSAPPPRSYEESVSQLANNVGQLIDLQKSLAPQPSQQLQSSLVHHVALANIDRMLEKLPPNQIEDTLVEITNFIYDKIKQNRNTEY